MTPRRPAAPLDRRRYRPAAPHHVLVTIDPGGDLCGVAVWLVSPAEAAGRLLGAAWLPVAEVVAYADGLARQVERAAAPPRPLAWSWVVEVPHLRGDSHATRSGVDALLRTLRTLRDGARLRPRRLTWAEHRPSRWKGNVPKPIHHARIARFLSDAERALLPAGALDAEAGAKGGYQPDRADAIGIGIWVLGRSDRGGTLPKGGGEPAS